MTAHPGKHDLVTGYLRGCPRAAYESMIDESPPDLDLLAIFKEGNVVDALAQESIMSDGAVVKKVGIGDASEETCSLMSDPSVSRINQATVVSPNGKAARLDSLQRAGEAWNHEEVKSGTSVKDKYVLDALVSTEIARRAGVEINEVRLVHLNPEWRLGMPVEDLFRTVDITNLTQDPVKVSFLSETYQALHDGKKPAASLVPGCWKTKEGSGKCPFFSRCFGETEYPITMLSRLSDAKISRLSHLGVVDIREIPEEFGMTPGQRVTSDLALNGRSLVNLDSLRQSLSGISPPVRHLDFEWVNLAVPVHEGVGPYGFVTTQFSIHLETDDGLEHTEHLSQAEGDGRRELAERVIDGLGEEGSIVVYSKAAEKGRIREMIGLFPDLSEPLRAIEQRLFDLEPVVKKCVIDSRFRQRSSLKVVLPVLVPGFGYEDLEIRGGGDAKGAMSLMIRGAVDPDEANLLRERLLRYCERDTEATARILQALRELVQGNRSSLDSI